MQQVVRLRDAVAVVADHTWAAKKGLAALEDGHDCNATWLGGLSRCGGQHGHLRPVSDGRWARGVVRDEDDLPEPQNVLVAGRELHPRRGCQLAPMILSAVKASALASTSAERPTATAMT